MPATKKTTKKATKKKSIKSAVPTGTVPPYGEAIRGAVARGDTREMKNVAASTRKWLADVESALTKLESAIKKS
jgi:hypothetical protein